MGRPKTLIDSNLIEAIKQDIKSIKNSDVVMRLKAIHASYFHKESDVADIFGIARSTLLKWISNYKKHGIEGCKSKPRGHNPAILTAAEKEIIKKWIISGKDHSDVQVHWTLIRLVKEIQIVFNKSITKTPLWLALISMNLTLKKPRPKHYKSDPEKQAEFKKNSRITR
jgi:transposase